MRSLSLCILVATCLASSVVDDPQYTEHLEGDDGWYLLSFGPSSIAPDESATSAGPIPDTTTSAALNELYVSEVSDDEIPEVPTPIERESKALLRRETLTGIMEEPRGIDETIERFTREYGFYYLLIALAAVGLRLFFTSGQQAT